MKKILLVLTTLLFAFATFAEEAKYVYYSSESSVIVGVGSGNEKPKGVDIWISIYGFMVEDATVYAEGNLSAIGEATLVDGKYYRLELSNSKGTTSGEVVYSYTGGGATQYTVLVELHNAELFLNGNPVKQEDIIPVMINRPYEVSVRVDNVDSVTWSIMPKDVACSITEMNGETDSIAQFKFEKEYKKVELICNLWTGDGVFDVRTVYVAAVDPTKPTIVADTNYVCTDNVYQYISFTNFVSLPVGADESYKLNWYDREDALRADATSDFWLADYKEEEFVTKYVSLSRDGVESKKYPVVINLVKLPKLAESSILQACVGSEQKLSLTMDSKDPDENFIWYEYGSDEVLGTGKTFEPEITSIGENVYYEVEYKKGGENGCSIRGYVDPVTLYKDTVVVTYTEKLVHGAHVVELVAESNPLYSCGWYCPSYKSMWSSGEDEFDEINEEMGTARISFTTPGTKTISCLVQASDGCSMTKDVKITVPDYSNQYTFRADKIVLQSIEKWNIQLYNKVGKLADVDYKLKVSYSNPEAEKYFYFPEDSSCVKAVSPSDESYSATIQAVDADSEVLATLIVVIPEHYTAVVQKQVAKVNPAEDDGEYQNCVAKYEFELGSAYNVDILVESDEDVVVDHFEYGDFDVLEVRDGQIFTLAEGGEYFNARMSNDSVISMYVNVVATVDKWAVNAKNVEMNTGTIYMMSVKNVYGDEVSEFVDFDLIEGNGYTSNCNFYAAEEAGTAQVVASYKGEIIDTINFVVKQGHEYRFEPSFEDTILFTGDSLKVSIVDEKGNTIPFAQNVMFGESQYSENGMFYANKEGVFPVSAFGLDEYGNFFQISPMPEITVIDPSSFTINETEINVSLFGYEEFYCEYFGKYGSLIKERITFALDNTDKPVAWPDEEEINQGEVYYQFYYGYLGINVGSDTLRISVGGRQLFAVPVTVYEAFSLEPTEVKNMHVGEEIDFSCKYDGEELGSSVVSWIAEAPMSPIDDNPPMPCAHFEDGTLYADAEGSVNIVAIISNAPVLIDGELKEGNHIIQGPKVTITQPSYYLYLASGTEDLTVNKDTATYYVYDMNSDPEHGEPAQIALFDVEQNFNEFAQIQWSFTDDLKGIKVWATGNASLTGMMRFSVLEGDEIIENAVNKKVKATYSGINYEVASIMFMSLDYNNQELYDVYPEPFPADYEIMVEDSSVVSFKEGMVTALDYGHTRINVTNQYGLVAYTDVYVVSDIFMLYGPKILYADGNPCNEKYSVSYLEETEYGIEENEIVEAKFRSSEESILSFADGVVTPLDEGTVQVYAYISTLDGDLVVAQKSVTVVKQMKAPEFSNNISYCEGSEPANVNPTYDFATLVWYDNDGEVVEQPKFSELSAGSYVYYVNQKTKEDYIGELDLKESEKVEFKFEVLAYPEVPVLNMESQIVCSEDELEAFSVTNYDKTVFINWLVNGEYVKDNKSEENTYMPVRMDGQMSVQAAVELNGCVSYSKTASVVVNKIEVPQIEFEAGINEFYVGEEFSISATNIDETEYDVKWIINDNEYEGSKVSVAFNDAARYDFACFAANKTTGCVGETDSAVVVKAYEQMELPGVEPEFQSISYCEGDLVEFPVWTTYDFAILKWYDEKGNEISGQVSAVLPVGDHKVFVSQAPNKKYEGYLIESEKVEILVIVHPHPDEPLLNTYEQKVCSESDILPFEVTNKSDDVDYQWYVNKGYVTSGTTTFLPNLTSEVLNIKVCAVSNGCPISSQIAVVEAVAAVTPQIIFAKGSNEVLVGETVDLSVPGVDDNNYDIEWLINETKYTGAKISVTFKDAGTYNVVCYASEKTTGCQGQAEEKVIVDFNGQISAPYVKSPENVVCLTAGSAVFMDIFAAPTSELAELKWYDETGNALEKTPEVSQLGTTTYYVSQVIKGEKPIESEKVKVSVSTYYVPTPTLNMYDQKLCDSKEIAPFVASSNYQVKWYQNGLEVATGSVYSPILSDAAKSEYNVVAYDEKTGCQSDVVTTTVTFGTPVVPEIIFANEKLQIAKGEPVEMSANIDTESYAIVWIVNGQKLQGETVTVGFDEAGSYDVVCQSIQKNTGCSAEKTATITVEESVVPVTSIAIDAESLEMYVGNKQTLAVSVVPSFATDQTYTMTVENSAIAEIRGNTVYALAAGTTLVNVVSNENPEVSTSIELNVKDGYVPVTEIDAPKYVVLVPGEVRNLDVKVYPQNATNKELTYKAGSSLYEVDSEGTITASEINEGFAEMTISSKDGVAATVMVYVTSSEEDIEDFDAPAVVVVKVGESKTISYSIATVSAKVNTAKFVMSDSDIALCENGVVTGLQAGETTLTLTIGDISKNISVIVNKSDAPILNLPKEIHISNVRENSDLKSLEIGTALIPISKYISDDNTPFENLKIEAVSSDEAVSVSIDENGKLFVNAGEFIGTVDVTLTVTDVDELTSTGSFKLIVEELINQAPVLLVDVIKVKYNQNVYVNLSDIASDDYTAVEDLLFEFNAEKVEVELKGNELRLKSTEPTLTSDVLNVKVTDMYGKVLDGTIALEIAAAPNQAPVISAISTQVETDAEPFVALNLTKYVTDDYTSPSSIMWSATQSNNIAVSIVDGIAKPIVLNSFWNGVEAITFTAKDDEGLTDTVVVYYQRTVSQQDSYMPKWEGVPTVTISTMRQIGVPGDAFVLMANISSFDCSWEWNIPGANGIDPTSLMQTITFDQPGVYPVSLTVTSADEKYSITADLAIQLTVVGVQERNLSICQGQSVVLSASEGLTSYFWSTDEVSSAISVRPETTTTYAVKMKKGMFTMTDSVVVTVSVPVSLIEDSVMCAGTTYELEAQGDYVSYYWNTNSQERSIVIPAEVAEYSVFAIDEMRCASVDTFNVTKVNELPTIDLGEDQTPCDGETVTLDAGAGFDYLWSNGSTEQQVALTGSTNTMWVRIIDENKCINSDTVTVAFKYPYAEQIGVATFSETTNHVILAWEKTVDVNTVKYRIERETGVTDNWEQVGEDVLFSEPGIVVDEEANFNIRAYKYRLVTTDGCGNEAISEAHRSMVATYMVQDNGLKTVHWTAYEPKEMITQYLILRGTDPLAMDTVEEFPASNLYEIWNETDNSFKGRDDILYRVVFRLKSEVNENRYNDVDGNEVEVSSMKAESGPFSLAMSNIAEAEHIESIQNVAFPADVVVYPSTITNVINVAIVAQNDEDFTVSVVSSNGQVVKTIKTGDVSKTLLQIPADDLTQGLYNVTISVGSQMKTFKVVK